MKKIYPVDDLMIQSTQKFKRQRNVSKQRGRGRPKKCGEVEDIYAVYLVGFTHNNTRVRTRLFGDISEFLKHMSGL